MGWRLWLPQVRCTAAALYVLLYGGSGATSGKEPNQKEENDGANKSRYQADEVETGESPTKAQCAQNETTYEGTDDTHDDVSYDAESSATNNETCQPTGDPANDDPNDDGA
jgi:hypothetical protein